MSTLVSAKPADAADAIRFFKAWVAAPISTGAQLPSGPALSKAMAAAVDPGKPGHVVELGPGTGPITRALLRRGVAPERLVLVERNPRFCALLRRRYPGVLVLSEDAFAAPRLLREAGIGPVAAVVSGLPLTVFHPRRRQRLLLQWLGNGDPETPFIQFTYFRGSPIPLRSQRIAAESSPIIWNNLWPARVWTYRHRNAALHAASGQAAAPESAAAVE